ncbi:MAG: hypothetical protein LPK02_00315 [Rhodobacterales bacterium]|nr:hypothetical protein [Rhodobacterales bacterium]MDX5411478.1 hypothetical protein [Rhodobacterales bacterium]
MKQASGAARVREKKMKKIQAFLRDECGAVTTEWVVLVAAVLMLGVTVFFAVDSGTMDLAEGTSDYMTDATN